MLWVRQDSLPSWPGIYNSLYLYNTLHGLCIIMIHIITLLEFVLPKLHISRPGLGTGLFDSIGFINLFIAVCSKPSSPWITVSFSIQAISQCPGTTPGYQRRDVWADLGKHFISEKWHPVASIQPLAAPRKSKAALKLQTTPENFL